MRADRVLETKGADISLPKGGARLADSGREHRACGPNVYQDHAHDVCAQEAHGPSDEEALQAGVHGG